MSRTTPLISPSQIRAARALLNWTQEQLAAEADLGVATIRDYENERRGSVIGSLREIEDALRNGGVEFIHPDRSGGSGVRLLGELPEILRWPTRRGIDNELVIRISHHGSRFDIFLSDSTLEDLAPPGHEPSNNTYIALIEQWKKSIQKAAAAKIDAGQTTPDKRVHLSDSDIRNA